jgi:dihydrofolate synthase/folylpolyglutamate synthase
VGCDETVCDAQVAVITNIGLDHTEYAGPTTADIDPREVGESSSPASAVVIGRLDPSLVAGFQAGRGKRTSFAVRGEDFDVLDNQLALHGPDGPTSARDHRLLPGGVPVPLYGYHQGDGKRRSVAADRGGGVSLGAPPVSGTGHRPSRGSPRVTMPGRFEVARPPAVGDHSTGSHNHPAGAESTAREGSSTNFDPAGRRILVVGLPARPRPGGDAVWRCVPTSSTSVLTCNGPDAAWVPAAQL